MPNANWSNPTLTSTYTNFVSEVKNRDEDLALQFDGTTSTNIPTNAIRWDSGANRWKKWNGSTWAELTSTYALTGLSTTGNATVGGTLGVTGAATLSAGGTSTTPAVDNNTTAIATTAFVAGQASSASPLVNGTATAGTSLRYSRQDHVHPTDTTRAPLASPTFTGTVTIPAGASISGYAQLASPAFTGTPVAPTAAIGTNTTQLATTAYVKSEISNSSAANVTGTVAIANGGTGQTTATNAINALVPSQTGNSGKYLTTNGSAVSWGTINTTTVANYQLFTSSGTWTCPAGVTQAIVAVIGGGAGCSSTLNSIAGGGGVGIGLLTVTPSANYSITVGAGGTGSNTTTGGTGGTSSFAGLIDATGGSTVNGTCTSTAANIRRGLSVRDTSLPYPQIIGTDAIPIGAGLTPKVYTITVAYGPGAGGTGQNIGGGNGSGGCGGAILIIW